MPVSGQKQKNGEMSSKKKKSPSQVQNQRTISSFFKTGAIKPTKSTLFSEVGKSSESKFGLTKTKIKTKYKENDIHNGENPTDAIIIDDDFKPVKTASYKQKFNLNGKESESNTKLDSIESSHTAVKTSVNSDESFSIQKSENVLGVHSEISLIPETQESMATKTPNVKVNHMEDEIIPDTPQSETKDEMPKKKVFGRSFLTAGSNISQNPYVMKKDKVDKKKLLVSKARKGLISVSVKFNSTEKKSDNLNENNHNKDLTIENTKCEVSPQHRTAEADIVGEYDQENGHVHTSDSETPTKIYEEDRISMKRMSKSGDSPHAKRVVECIDFESNSHSESRIPLNLEKLMEPYDEETSHQRQRGSYSCELDEGNSFDQNRESIGRGKVLLDDEINSSSSNIKDKKEVKSASSKTVTDFQPKTESSISYQLSMVRKKKKKGAGSLRDNEDCLGDILDELTDKKNNCQDSEFTNFKPSVMSLKKKRKSLQNPLSSSGTNFKSNISIDESLTEDDLKYLDDLDGKIHQGVGFCSNLTDKGPDTDTSNPQVFKKPNFLTKKEVLSEKKYGQKTEIGDTDDENIPTQTIVEFLSQMGKEDIDDKEDIDIVEFPSQTESQELCEELVMSSPFETQKKDSQDIQPACLQYGRHQIKNVERNLNDHEVTLHLIDTVSEQEKICTLSGFWADTHVSENDIVHIVGRFEGDKCHITDKDGLIIVNPDVLLSGTTVVSSVFCMRKGILNEKFKGCDAGNIQMLYGSIIHCVFQQVLQKKLTREEDILQEAEETVKQTKFLHDMYKGNTTEGEVLEEIKKYIPQIRKWLEQYTNLIPGRDSNRKEDGIKISQVKDIEENMWCPRYGIKGKIDLTVEVKIKNKGHFEKSVVPLELKTGRPTYSMEHKGQVTLYSVMSSERRLDPQQGLLLYLREPDMKVIPADHLNIRGLIQLRNEMAYYLSRQVFKTTSDEGLVSYQMGRLPDPINNQRACQKCAQLTNCCIYQSSVEQRNFNSSMASLVPNTLGHLLQEHLDFYVHWCLLLDLETKASTDKGGISDLWCKSAYKREQEGNSFSGLRIVQNKTDTKAEYVVLTFKRHDETQSVNPLNMIGIAVNDYMIISTEKTNYLALCNGTVVRISEESVDVAIESESLPRLLNLEGEIFRLDRYSSFSTVNILYTNMSKLMADEPRSEKLRNLIIQKKSPEFVIKLSKTEIEKVKEIFKPLNKPQKTAVLKVLMSKDYILIKGYPGTGKTATIVAIVRVLNLLGLSVLLTSYTHSAVDNILQKLLKYDIKFVRLGKTSKIHPKIQKYSADILTQKLKSVADLREFYSQQKVVATSCLGISNPVFTQKRFDVCIVDEASQVLLPACLGPLFCADKFVLVGDPKQLPPVVQSKEARTLGMDQSLFSMLDDLGGTYELNLQYRMNSQIMALSNLLVYDGALKCGSDDVANGQIEVDIKITTEKWLQQVLSDTPYKAAVFVDTSKIIAVESKDSSGMVINVGESKLVQQLVSSCIKGGISSEDIGVIAPYRRQVRLIHDSLPDHSVEVNTVDQYQGRDKDIIIISFTRSFRNKSSGDNKSGELLKDVRRLNVAVSRAKKKLIMIGDQETLKTYEPLSVILKMMAENDLIVTIPKDIV